MMLQPDPHVLREAMRRTITAGKAAGVNKTCIRRAPRFSRVFVAITHPQFYLFLSFPFFYLFLYFFPQCPRQPTVLTTITTMFTAEGVAVDPTLLVLRAFSFTRPPIHSYHPLHYPTPATSLTFSYHLCCRRNSCSPSCPYLVLSVIIVVHLSARRTRIRDLCRHQQVLATAHQH